MRWGRGAVQRDFGRMQHLQNNTSARHGAAPVLPLCICKLCVIQVKSWVLGTVTQTCLCHIKFRRSIPFTLAQPKSLNYLCLFNLPEGSFLPALLKHKVARELLGQQTGARWRTLSAAGLPSCIPQHKGEVSSGALPALSLPPILPTQWGPARSPWKKRGWGTKEDRVPVLTPGKHQSPHCKHCSPTSLAEDKAGGYF